MPAIAIFAALLVTAVISLFWLRRPSATCPTCQSKQLVKIDETVKSIRTIETGTSGMGGGGQLLEMQITTQYRCQTCQHTWSETHRET